MFAVTPAPTAAMQDTDILLKAEELGLRRFSGSPFWGISLSVTPHQIIAVSGEHGSGKSALLLTLAGYMKFTSGKLRIGDAVLPRERKRSRRYVGLGLFGTLNELCKTQTVAEALAAELKLAAGCPLLKKQYGEFAGNRGALFRYADDMLARWKVSVSSKTLIGDLTPDKRTRLGIALALLKQPQLLFLDDIETELTGEQSRLLWSDLRSYVTEHYCSCLVGVLRSEFENCADGVTPLD